MFLWFFLWIYVPLEKELFTHEYGDVMIMCRRKRILYKEISVFTLFNKIILLYSKLKMFKRGILNS